MTAHLHQGLCEIKSVSMRISTHLFVQGGNQCVARCSPQDVEETSRQPLQEFGREWPDGSSTW